MLNTYNDSAIPILESEIRRDPAARHLALCISYDGTAYHGWQFQKGLPTVCRTLQEAIAEIVGHPVSLHGCGRTDAGVHALHYVTGFSAYTRIPADRIPYALRMHLPENITVWQAADVPASFSAIGSCIRKEYTYRIYTGRHPDPFLARRALFCSGELNVDVMQRAAADYVGKHDFSALRSLGSTQVKSTVRTVYSSEITARGRHIFFKVSANGFLYNMVRAMMGTLLYIGLGKLPPTVLPTLLDGGSRVDAGPTAPPHGLYMTGAWYDEALPWQSYRSLEEDTW